MGENGQTKEYSNLNIAVIGNGRWAQNHIRILKEYGAFLGAYDIETDYKKVINGSINGTLPDGVVIATDPVMHFPITEYAMSRKVAVYCEKPIATQTWQLDELMKLRKTAIYQAGFQLLYDPKINHHRNDKIKTIIVVSKKITKSNNNKLSKFPVELIVTGERSVNIKSLLRKLSAKKIKTILVEGGGTINWEFIKQGLFDEIIVTVTPFLIGGTKSISLVQGLGFSKISKSTKLKLKKIKQQKNELVLHYIKL